MLLALGFSWTIGPSTGRGNEYTASQAYFNDNSSGILTGGTTDIADFGSKQSPGVNITAKGDIKTLTITAKFASGDTTYTVHQDGIVISEKK
jgi:hypothetical protein